MSVFKQPMTGAYFPAWLTRSHGSCQPAKRVFKRKGISSEVLSVLAPHPPSAAHARAETVDADKRQDTLTNAEPLERRGRPLSGVGAPRLSGGEGPTTGGSRRRWIAANNSSSESIGISVSPSLKEISRYTTTSPRRSERLPRLPAIREPWQLGGQFQAVQRLLGQLRAVHPRSQDRCRRVPGVPGASGR